MENLMQSPSKVRNVSVIGHEGHGKSTLVNTIRADAEKILHLEGSRAEASHAPDPTTRLTPFPITYHAYEEATTTKDIDDSQEYLLHLLDTPGHVDFVPEVTTALRLGDGALVVVDALHGLTIACERSIRQALDEQSKMILCITSFDLALLKPGMSQEHLYQRMLRTVQAVNNVSPTVEGMALPEARLSPCDGNVAFGDGLHGWAFTLGQLAERYEQKLNIKKEELTKLFWGDNFFNPQKNTWSTSSEYNGSQLERGFNRFVLDPILKMVSAVEEDDKAALLALLGELNIRLNADEMAKTNNELFVAIMQTFLPAKQCISGMIIRHLPSPDIAQMYRAEALYEGPMSDEVAIGMKSCDPKAQLILNVCKIVDPESNGRFLAFGRVFSGTVHPDQKVSIHKPSEASLRHWRGERLVTIKQVSLVSGHLIKAMNGVPAGNIVAVTGITDAIKTPVTVTTDSSSCDLKILKPPPTPLLRRIVEVSDPKDLPELVEAFKILSRCDWSAAQENIQDDDGRYHVTAVGERHMGACLKILQDRVSVPLAISEPSIVYRETILGTSDTVLAKSPNKRSRIYASAETLPPDISLTRDRYVAIRKHRPKEALRILHDDYGWDEKSSRIWAFSTGGSDSCMLVDQTKAVQYLFEFKDWISSGFHWATGAGPLASEPMVSSRINIIDVTMNCDPIHRGGGQVILATRRAIYGSVLMAEPAFQEPVYSVEAWTTEQDAPDVLRLFTRRKGCIRQDLHASSAPFVRFLGHLPVAQSIGLNSELHQISGRQARAQLVFDHWSTIHGGSPTDQMSDSGKLAIAIRRSKGLSTVLPTADMYRDKL